MDMPPLSHLDPTLMTGLGLVLGSAAKTLFDYAIKRLRPSEDPDHERRRKEILAEAEALRKELREEIHELKREADRWKSRYYRLLALLREVPELRDRLTAEVSRIANELS
jgi:molecular chaperone GrpE (heat shock protein)